MAIKFKCPRCSTELNVKDDMAGKQGKCPSCKTVVTVPAPAAARSRPSGTASAAPARKPAAEEEEIIDAEVVEEEEEVVEAEIIEDEPKPKPRGGKRDTKPDDFDFAPVAEVEEDTRVTSRPSRRREEDDEEDEPRGRRSRGRRDEEEDEDDRPSRRKRASARRSRDDDDDYDDDEEDEDDDRSDRRKKARARKRKQAWRRAGAGVFLNFIAMCLYTGACGVGLLMYIVTLITAASRSQAGAATGFGFVGILGYLVLGLILVNWILSIIGYSMTIATPGRHGEMGLAIASVSLGAIVLLLFLSMMFGDFGGLGAMSIRGAMDFGMMMMLFPLIEIARTTVFAFYIWDVGKSIKDEAVESSGLMLGILVPSVLFGLALFSWLFMTLVVRNMSPGSAVYVVAILAFLNSLALIGLWGWYALVLSTAKRSIDYAN